MPNLWQGSRPPEGDTLSEGGFRVLVLCAEEIQPPASSFPGLTVLRAPNDDDFVLPVSRAILQKALQTARQVAKHVQQGHQCLVTCAAGMNRSGLVSALTLHTLNGWSGEQCSRWIRKHRKSLDGYIPLSNPQFNVVLRRLSAVQAQTPEVKDDWKQLPSGLFVAKS